MLGCRPKGAGRLGRMFPSTTFGLGWQELLTFGFTGLVVVVCLGVIARSLLVPSDVRRTCCCGGCGVVRFPPDASVWLQPDPDAPASPVWRWSDDER